MVDIDGATLAYTREGNGIPLICLHGGMGIDSASLRVPGILRLAKHGCEVVIFDQRGHGDSSDSPSTWYSNQVWAGDVFKFTQRFAWARFAVLGHSYGGFIALEYALRWAHTISHLILVSTSAGPVVTGSVPLCSQDRDVRNYFQERWTGLFAGADKHWELFRRLRFNASPFNASFSLELPKYDLRSKVQDIVAPVLLVVGKDDRYRGDMEWLAEQLPNASLTVFPGVGHFPFIEAQEKFLKVVSSFLAGTVSRKIHQPEA